MELSVLVMSGLMLILIVHTMLGKAHVGWLDFLRLLCWMVEMPVRIAAFELACMLDIDCAVKNRRNFGSHVRIIARCMLVFVIKRMVDVPPWAFAEPPSMPPIEPVTRNVTCMAKEMRGVTRMPDGTVMRCSVRVLLCITTKRRADGRIVVTQRIISDPACQRDPEFLLDGGVETAPLPVPDAKPVMPMC